jgi:hypothetical protein
MGYHIFWQQQETASEAIGECSKAMIPAKLEQMAKQSSHC